MTGIGDTDFLHKLLLLNGQVLKVRLTNNSPANVNLKKHKYPKSFSQADFLVNFLYHL